MSKYLFTYIKFCISLMAMLNKWSFRKVKFHKTSWIWYKWAYHAEYAYINRKDCVASLMLKIFYNAEAPFDTEFYTFVHKYLEPAKLASQLHYNHQVSNGETEEETFVFADGSVLDIYKNVTGYWEPVVRTKKGKTFFFNPNKDIEEEDENSYWWRKHPYAEEEYFSYLKKYY